MKRKLLSLAVASVVFNSPYLLAQDDEAAGVRHAEGPEDDGVHHREDGGGRGHPDGQDQPGHDAGAGHRDDRAPQRLPLRGLIF